MLQLIKIIGIKHYLIIQKKENILNLCIILINNKENQEIKPNNSGKHHIKN